MPPCSESLLRRAQILVEALAAQAQGPVGHEASLRAPRPSVGTAGPLEAGEQCARLCQDVAPPPQSLRFFLGRSDMKLPMM